MFIVLLAQRQFVHALYVLHLMSKEKELWPDCFVRP